jgi:hypothetical protein
MSDVLVTGTGRCGTGGWTAMLQQCGVNATHEGHFTPIGYHHPFRPLPMYEQSWMGAVHLDWWKEQDPNRKIILLWRDPVATIRSLLGIGFFTGIPADPYQRYANRHSDAWVTYSHPNAMLERAIYFWRTWNRRILNSGLVDSVQYVYKPDYETVAPWYGLTETGMGAAAAAVGQKVNSRQRAELGDETIDKIMTACGPMMGELERASK